MVSFRHTSALSSPVSLMILVNQFLILEKTGRFRVEILWESFFTSKFNGDIFRENIIKLVRATDYMGSSYSEFVKYRKHKFYEYFNECSLFCAKSDLTTSKKVAVVFNWSKFDFAYCCLFCARVQITLTNSHAGNAELTN